MYVTETMIKFIPLSFFKQSAKPRINIVVNPLFAKCTVLRVNDFYTLQSLNTCVDRSTKNLLVQFHHINDREGKGVCVLVVLKIYWSNLIQ